MRWQAVAVSYPGVSGLMLLKPPSWAPSPPSSKSPGAVRGPDRLLTSNRSVRVMLRRGFSPNCPVTALPVLITTLILFVTHFQTIQEKENGKVGLERTPSLITPSHCVLYINLLKLRLTPAGVTFISLLFYLPGGSSTSLRAWLGANLRFDMKTKATEHSAISTQKYL